MTSTGVHIVVVPYADQHHTLLVRGPMFKQGSHGQKFKTFSPGLST